MKESLTKASMVFDLRDFSIDPSESYASDIESLLDADMIYDKILKPFIDTCDAFRIKTHKYHIEVIEPYNFKESTDHHVNEIALALFDVTKFRLVFYYRIKFGKLTDKLIEQDFDKYDYDSVYSELLQYIAGYRRFDKYTMAPNDRISVYLSGGKIDKHWDANGMTEFSPYITKSSINCADICVGDDLIPIPVKYSKYLNLKYPFKSSRFLEFIHINTVDMLKSLKPGLYIDGTKYQELEDFKSSMPKTELYFERKLD